MDGLLIDSEPLWRKAHVDAVREQGSDIVITKDDVRAMTGRRTSEVVEHWREKYGLHHIAGEELAASVVAKVIDSIKLSGQAFVGVPEIMEMFKEHNIPITLASSSSPDVIEAVINKLGINQYIKLAYSAIHEEFGKPHPAVFLTTAQKMGVKPADCIVFEDSINGVKAAVAADMKCVAIPERPYDPEDFRQASVLVDSLQQVDWLLIESLWRN